MCRLFFAFLCVIAMHPPLFSSAVFSYPDSGNIEQSADRFGKKKIEKGKKKHRDKPKAKLEKPESENRLKRFLLITGCSRSGTTFIADVLSLCGLDIGHEIIGSDGCSSWFMCIDDGKAPWNSRPTARGIEFEHIFHQVRHPLDAISSIYVTEHPLAIQFFSANVPEISPLDSKLVKCCKFWYYWNLYAEKKAEWRYQIEQIEEVWDEMGQRLGIALDRNVLKEVSPKTNHRKRQVQFTWLELSEKLPEDLFAKIQELALRYGYSIND